MYSLLDTAAPDGELTADDLDTVVHALQLLKRKIEDEPLDLDPLLDYRDAYVARRERSEAVHVIIRKVRRDRAELRRL